MDEKIPVIGTGQSGRPTNQESENIDRILHECFIRGLSARFVIQKTGLNKNTVYRKFKEMEDGIKDEAPILDAVEERTRRRSQYYVTLDDLISRNYNMLDRVEESIESHHKRNAEIPAFLLQKFTDLTKQLFNLQQRKIAQVMQIPVGPMWLKNI